MHIAPPTPPVPLYLQMAMLNWLSSIAASQSWKHGLLNWNPSLSAPASQLKSELENNSSFAAFEQQVAALATGHLQSMLSGLQHYTSAPPPTLAVPPAAIMWREGNSRLLDYAPGSAGMPVLCIPSLINKSYILDLTENTSLLRFLAGRGLHPYLLDWGMPGIAEKAFSIEDYVARIAAACVAIGQPVALLGYCMGGLLSLAAAQLHPHSIQALSLLATPWNFHSPDMTRIALQQQDVTALRALLQTQDYMPKELIYLLFYMLDPWHIHEKYTGAQNYSPDFLAREWWVHDGVAMAAKVAETALIGWSYENQPYLGKWRVGEAVITPKAITMPSFIAIPAYDRIVPPLCAKALADAIPHATTVGCASGHIGMVVGQHARQQLWEPLVNWLSGL